MIGSLEDAGRDVHDEGYRHGFIDAHLTDVGRDALDEEAIARKIDGVALAESWDAIRDVFLRTARPTADEEVREALVGCSGIESVPNGSGGMRVVVHFASAGQETALFHLIERLAGIDRAP